MTVSIAAVLALALSTQAAATQPTATPPAGKDATADAHKGDVVDRSAPPKPGAPRPFTIQQPQDFKLKNGLRVLFLPRKRAPLVDVMAAVDAGINADPKELPGVAGWTAGMLTEGAGDMDSIAFSDAQNAIGAQIGSGAEPEHATVSLHVSSAKLADGMKLFAAALTKPRFDDKEWQRVAQQTFGYFMYQSNEPQELLGIAGARMNWGVDNRFGVNLSGTPRALAKTTTADLKAFYGARYRPDTTTLVVVGDVDKAALQKILDDTLGAWTATGKAPDAPKLGAPLPLTSRTVVAVNVAGAPQTVLSVQNPAPAEIKPYTPDVSVMNTLLGGSFTSRLNSNLREEHGYSYGATSHLVLFKNGNAFMVRTSVATPVTGAAVKEIIKELTRIREPATAEEVERARNLAALSVPSAFDNGRSTAGLWATIAAQGTDPKRLQHFMEDAPKVDVKGVQAVAQRVVDADKCTIVAVGDMDAIGKDLDAFGPRTLLTIDDLLPGLKEAAAQFAQQPGGE